jgi:hypothetical protein
MSTEHNYSVGSAQYEWLIKDLAAVNRSRTPWLIFGACACGIVASIVALTLAPQGGHRPMYISTVDDGVPGGDQVVADQLRDDLETALFKYQVDLAVRSLGCLPSI